MDQVSRGALVLGVEHFNVSHGPVQAIFDMELQVYAGEMLAILGPNGAGKSSLLCGIAGIVKNWGSVAVGGVALDGLPGRVRALGGVSFVPERRGNIFPTMSVEENLDIGLRLIPAHRKSSVLVDVLGLFPILAERMSAPAGMLSGGEQQMLAIGMALGREPKLLILDEPSQGLAPSIFDLLQDTFETLKRRHMAILLAEQNLPFAARIADRYAVLSHGELISVGERSDLQDPERILGLFFRADA